MRRQRIERTTNGPASIFTPQPPKERPQPLPYPLQTQTHPIPLLEYTPPSIVSKFIFSLFLMTCFVYSRSIVDPPASRPSWKVQSTVIQRFSSYAGHSRLPTAHLKRSTRCSWKRYVPAREHSFGYRFAAPRSRKNHPMEIMFL